jgi:hypothetical protein
MSYAIIGLYEDNERFREDLGSDRFESIVGAKKTYMLAVGLEENINLLIDNYDEFKAEMLKLADQARQGLHQMEMVARMRARLLLNRRIVNELTACRLYLDQSSHAISELFGPESVAASTATKRRCTVYDGSLSYRFMEGLRNYVQHRGLLVHCLAFKHSRIGDDLRFTLEPRLKLSYLEEDPKFKASVLNEIKTVSSKEADGEEVDLGRAMREYIAAIWSLHLENRDAIAQGCADRLSLYRSVVEQYQQRGGRRIIFPRVTELDPHGRQITEIFLLPNICEYYDKLCERKAVPVN